MPATPVCSRQGTNPFTRVSRQFFSAEGTMGKVIERILQVFGKKEEQSDKKEEVLLDFSQKPGTKERSAAVS